jgi:cytochrome P450
MFRISGGTIMTSTAAESATTSAPTTTFVPKRVFEAPIIFAIRPNPLDALLELAREFGDVVPFQLGAKPAVLLSDPNDIKDVLVTHNRDFHKARAIPTPFGQSLFTAEGEPFLRQRRLMQPAFHRQRIANYGQIMVDYANEWRKRWSEDKPIDIGEEMRTLTLAIVGKTLFDADNAESEATEVAQALDIFKQVFTPPTNGTGPSYGPTPPAGGESIQQAKARLDAILMRIISERRSSDEDKGDFLSMLMMARDTEGDNTGMSDQQVIDEAVTLFLSGHGTTASALMWTWYLLARNPDAEAALHAEVDAVLGGRAPTVDDVPKLRYTAAVFTEAMRVYPPAWVLGRVPLHDYSVRGLRVPAGTPIFMSQWVVHHDERLYPDPFQFKPERWMPEFKANLPKFAYFPFGGPRLCIGDAFAEMEGVLLIAAIAQAWCMRLVPDQPVEMEILATVRPKALPMHLKRRQ